MQDGGKTLVDDHVIVYCVREGLLNLCVIYFIIYFFLLLIYHYPYAGIYFFPKLSWAHVTSGPDDNGSVGVSNSLFFPGVGTSGKSFQSCPGQLSIGLALPLSRSNTFCSTSNSSSSSSSFPPKTLSLSSSSCMQFYKASSLCP